MNSIIESSTNVIVGITGLRATVLVFLTLKHKSGVSFKPKAPDK